ncbi:response regulator [Egicoccus sp. AB-alg2]|uniref:response regulator n=1 Tax=Egicoccus sp. AB-alg2 TaxID=3242693 RepID=UPI00359D16AB
MEPTGARPRVVVVDDHGLLAQSLRFALQANDMRVVICDELTEEAIVGAVTEDETDVVLLDLDIGGELGTSLSLIPRLSELGARVVMLTGVTDRPRLGACVEAGAVGVVGKSQPFDELVDAVKTVLADGTLLTPGQREALIDDFTEHRARENERLAVFERLTPKEAYVLRSLMDGATADQIAKEAVVSMATVRTQIRSVLAKLGVNSQLSAVALARKAGWDETSG